ncbi:DUF3800 domain-containing protein [uncultured Sphingomonas sp.]|uniref:DUF3800 domain-containing protein n=1 Tax=uncultured Sphingomonas sp. TaxID=158754 RepID=UPI0025F4B635|nr:DUF3800 domain-containing protein [uncultured Sphingomonas sp.]
MLEYLIYSDESVSKGDYFSNFYGGALVTSRDDATVRRVLAEKKAALNLGGEVKWQKITEAYEGKYIELMDAFFDLIESNKVKVRIMFTQNMFRRRGLTADQRDQQYFILYYQFIKHAFGLRHRTNDEPARLRLLLDQLPDTREKIERFKGFVVGLNSNPAFRRAGLSIAREDIADVDSKQHDLLQCLDVVLGSMQFRLNDKHLEIPPGQRRRGKRTRAKERVYRHISKRIRAIYPGFNIGITTGTAGGGKELRWTHRYRHWLFISPDSEIVGSSKRDR